MCTPAQQCRACTRGRDEAAGSQHTAQKSSGTEQRQHLARHRSTSLASKDAAAAMPAGNHARYPWDKEKGRGRAPAGTAATLQTLTSDLWSNDASASPQPSTHHNSHTARADTGQPQQPQARPRSSPAQAAGAHTPTRPRNASPSTHNATVHPAATRRLPPPPPAPHESTARAAATHATPSESSTSAAAALLGIRDNRGRQPEHTAATDEATRTSTYCARTAVMQASRLVSGRIRPHTTTPTRRPSRLGAHDGSELAGNAGQLRLRDSQLRTACHCVCVCTLRACLRPPHTHILRQRESAQRSSDSCTHARTHMPEPPVSKFLLPHIKMLTQRRPATAAAKGKQQKETAVAAAVRKRVSVPQRQHALA